MIEVPTIEVAQVPDPIPEGVTVLDVREPSSGTTAASRAPCTSRWPRSPPAPPSSPVDQQLLVVCKVGGRSAQVTAFLREKGFEAVNLAGGMIDWAAAGRPMVGDAEGDRSSSDGPSAQRM